MSRSRSTHDSRPSRRKSVIATRPSWPGVSAATRSGRAKFLSPSKDQPSWRGSSSSTVPARSGAFSTIAQRKFRSKTVSTSHHVSRDDHEAARVRADPLVVGLAQIHCSPHSGFAKSQKSGVGQHTGVRSLLHPSGDPARCVSERSTSRRRPSVFPAVAPHEMPNLTNPRSSGPQPRHLGTIESKSPG